MLSGVEQRMTDSREGFEVVRSIACVEGGRESTSSPFFEEGALPDGIDDTLRDEVGKLP